MKRTYILKLFYTLLWGVFSFQAMAQDNLPAESENYYEQFRNLENGELRSFFFFNTPNRYNQNSPYDWLDTVNVYLNSSEKTKDTASIRDYQLIQSQIYFDLGNYEKSLAISRFLYENIEETDNATNAIILRLMDNNYAKLELYDKQIEIRRKKRELGLTENVAFYDIYANLGQYRKAMRDYMTEEKKVLREDDYYGMAVYNNTIGNYLRLDKSTPTAISYFKKAEGLIQVYLSDVTKQRTDKELIDGKILNAIILGNIGKCHVELAEYEKAIPFFEESRETILKYNKGKFSSDFVENTLALAESYLKLDNYE
ncbi:MAG: histidine kinase, partial [Maribacter sp.]